MAAFDFRTIRIGQLDVTCAYYIEFGGRWEVREISLGAVVIEDDDSDWRVSVLIDAVKSLALGLCGS